MYPASWMHSHWFIRRRIAARLNSGVRPVASHRRCSKGLNSLPNRSFVFFSMLVSPTLAHASDPTELAIFLYAVLAVVFAIVFAITWLLTRRMSKQWLKISIRAAVVLLFWTPVPLGGAGYWWPVPFALFA